jgi:hypothetical protein
MPFLAVSVALFGPDGLIYGAGPEANVKKRFRFAAPSGLFSARLTAFGLHELLYCRSNIHTHTYLAYKPRLFAGEQ